MNKLTLDKEKIIERIDDIVNSVSELQYFQKMDLKEFKREKNNYPLACYHLRVALEAVLTIGTHILSRLPSNGKKKDYTQVIISLGDYGVISKNFSQKIKGMAGYRNRLVHLYWKVKHEEILAMVKGELNDFNNFIDHINKYLKLTRQ